MSGETDLRRGALGRIVDFEKLCRRETEHAREDHIGKCFARRVVGHDAVVVGLTREGDLVFGGGQLLGELHHVLVGLEIWILLRDDHEAGRSEEHTSELQSQSNLVCRLLLEKKKKKKKI